jgi:hypothetical protein
MSWLWLAAESASVEWQCLQFPSVRPSAARVRDGESGPRAKAQALRRLPLHQSQAEEQLWSHLSLHRLTEAEFGVDDSVALTVDKPTAVCASRQAKTVARSHNLGSAVFESPL